MEIWAEAGRCEGDINYALQAAQAVKDAGADVLKVQWHHPDRIFSANIPRYDKTDNRDITMNELDAARIEYPEWFQVITKCHELGIRFIPSIFDPEAIEWLNTFGLSHAKIASGDITNRWLIQQLAEALRYHHGHPPTLCISTGASTAEEIKWAIGWVVDTGFRGNIQLLACHLAYPTTGSDANLGRVAGLAALVAEMIAARQFGNVNNVQLGYSDHTSYVATTQMLVAMGASVHEKHFTLLGPGHGSDHEFAVDPIGLQSLVKTRNKALVILGSAQLVPTEAEQPARQGARRSLAATVDIPQGTRLTADMFIMLRPGTGIPPYELGRVIGSGKEKQLRAMVDIPAGTIVTWKMIGLVGATLSVE